MKATLLIVLAVSLAGQISGPRPQDLLEVDRPLRADEIATVLASVRAALAGKAVRLARPEGANGGSGREMIIGRNGLPHFERTSLSYEGGWVGGAVDGTPLSTHYRVDALVITEFTGRAARGCDGTPRVGELMIEYTNEGHGWTTKVKTMRGLGYPAGAFDILTGALPSHMGERGFVAGRIARAFIARWTPPPDGHSQPPLIIGDPFPNVRRDPPPSAQTQTLWIDAESLLPLQWESPGNAFAFRYDPAITIAQPDGVTAPNCVP